MSRKKNFDTEFFRHSLLELAQETCLPEQIREIRAKGKKTISLVLSGGAALGPHHVGVIGALWEAGIVPDIIVGTSAGALTAAVASRCHSLDAWLRIKRAAKELNWSRLSQIAFFRNGGLLKFDNLAAYVSRHLKDLKKIDSQKSPIPVVFVATDITSFPFRRPRLVAHLVAGLEEEGRIGKAVQASCSIPVLVQPVKYGGRVYVDGSALIKEGFEPVGIARFLVPASLIITVRLEHYHGFLYPSDQNVIRIEPCRRERNGVFSSAFFERDDVWRGYCAALAAVDIILAQMAEQGINKTILPGFNGESGTQLPNYFSQKRLAD